MTKTGGKPSLPPEQAKRVRQAMKDLLRDQFEENKTALGRAIGKSQSAVSQLIAGDNSASLETAEAVAALMKTNVWVLLGKAPDRFVVTVETPEELQQVLDAEPPDGVKGLYTEEDLDTVKRHYARADGARPTSIEWKAIMRMQIAHRHDMESKLPPKIASRVLHDDPTEPAPKPRKKKSA